MKNKKKKLESLPKIHRRLFKLWGEKVRSVAQNTCEYCGRKVGDLDDDGKKLVKVDSHHIQSRKVSGNPLKWDVRNSVCACPLHHKFSCNESFHRAPAVTINWLIKNRPERFNYILEHYKDKVDLDNRLILAEIERCLNNNELIDVEKLKQIEKEFPRQPKITKTKVDISKEYEEDVPINPTNSSPDPNASN
jgi:hypothetical protein